MFSLSITTDYHGDRGCPQTRLQYAAEAGFTHLHWCHQWCTDFLYGAAEWEAIDSWLKEYHLTLLDIHGSAGQEKCWYSVEEYERQAGVQLVANRLEMLRARNRDSDVRRGARHDRKTIRAMLSFP